MDDHLLRLSAVRTLPWEFRAALAKLGARWGRNSRRLRLAGSLRTALKKRREYPTHNVHEWSPRAFIGLKCI
jgi:hypothetical protein